MWNDKDVSRRWVLTAGASLGLAGGLASLYGCSSKKSDNSTTLPTSGTVDIGLLSVTGLSGWWKDVVALFNKDSKFKVNAKITTISNGNAKTQLPAALSANDAPDLAYTLPAHSVTGGLVKADLLADLSPYAQKYGWEKRYSRYVWNSFKYPGSLPVVGYDATPHTFIWYKPEQFHKLGLTVPANRQVSKAEMDQYVSAARNAGLQPVALGNKDIWPGSQTMDMVFQRLLDDDTLAKLQAGWTASSGVKWTDAGPLKAITTTQQLANTDKWFEDAFNSVSDTDADNLLVSNKSLMVQEGYWFQGVAAQTDPKGKYDFFQFPILDTAQPVRVINFSANGMVIPKKAKNPAVAAALFNTALSPDGQRLLLEKYNTLPGTKGYDSGGSVKYPNQNLAEIVKLLDTERQNPFQMENDSPPELGQSMMKLTATLLAGAIKPEDFAGQLQSMIDKNIQANK